MPNQDDISLSEGEFRLITLLDDRATNQRSLARAAGMSLGMTNLLIKRLAKKGLIKVGSLNGRTLSYILTPRGFAEKVRRSYHYLQASIQYVRDVRRRAADLLARYPDREIWILGEGDIAGLASEALDAAVRPYRMALSLEDLPPGDHVLCIVCVADVETDQSGRFETLLA